MRSFAAIFLLVTFTGWPAFAQQPVYDAFEVDSAAQVPGGMEKLSLFIQTTLRPTMATLATGVKGRVFVQAVVGPDGQVSNLAVVRGLRPDADREALRVVGVFNAWQPALKRGQPVPQKVIVPVEFRFPPAPWRYENGKKIEFFGADQQPTANETGATFKLVTPMDSLGNLTDDAVIYRLDAPTNEYARNTFSKQGVWQVHGSPVTTPDSVRFYRLMLFNPEGLPNGEVRHLYASGEIRSIETADRGRMVGISRHFHPNGAIQELVVRDDQNGAHILRWFSTGQLRDDATDQGIGVARQRTLANAWASDGRPLVVNGSGTLRDTTEFGTKQLVEEGAYLTGRKQGRWTGVFTDGKPFYEETYEAGELTGGQSYDEAGQTVQYTVLEQQPEFRGGQQALVNFLSANLSYPAEAQRMKTQGRVMVTFVVQPDGTLTDVKSLNHLGDGLDREAVRVVKKMSGRWTPGTQRGRPVKARFNLPITFQLSSSMR